MKIKNINKNKNMKDTLKESQYKYQKEQKEYKNSFRFLKI
jgi:hypothetical protein